MSPNVAPLFEAARSLSTAERQELIDLLEDQFDPSDDVVPQLSEEWKAEIARRSAEYDAGLAQTISWEEVKAKSRARRAANG